MNLAKFEAGAEHANAIGVVGGQVHEGERDRDEADRYVRAIANPGKVREADSPTTAP